MRPIVLKLSDNVTIINGDCRDVLPVECDAVVTDPPYQLEMGGGVIGKALAKGIGTQTDALLHGCAEGWCLNMPGVWRKGVAK